MKPIKFRIKNYKSIQDSGDCYFDDKITILAGKNESGKSTILKALKDFDLENDFELDKDFEDTTPIWDDEAKTEVCVTFLINTARIKEMLKRRDIEVSGLGNKKDLLFEIVKKSLYYSAKFIDVEPKIVVPAFEKYFLEKLNRKEVIGTNKTIREWLMDNYSEETILNVIQTAITNNTFTFKPGGLNKVYSFAPEQMEDLKKFRDNILEYFEMKDGAIDVNSIILEEIESESFPHFIFFDSFDDIFPDSISISEIEENTWARSLEKVSDFDISKIILKDKQKQQKFQDKINANFTSIFKKYWTQDIIKLTVAKDGDTIYFFIDEEGELYKPSQRSKGQQWYLSFFVKVIAKMSEEVPNVILIDEPGLYLHAKAQKNLLLLLEESFKNNIIMFSTHSPYLIQEENLKNIRLVEKINRKTKIISKYWANATLDTKTPILTAIGVGVSDSIVDIKKNNIIVEGLEDVYYMRAFSKLIGNVKEVNFINGGGAPKVGLIGNILFGWGAEVKYLFDFDRGGIQGKNKLEKVYDICSEDIIFCSDIDGEATIDLLSTSDFIKYVKEDYEEKQGTKSRTISDKPLTSRKFLDKVNNNEVFLDETSLKNIQLLFEKIQFK